MQQEETHVKILITLSYRMRMKYEDHPSIQLIKSQSQVNLGEFTFRRAEKDDIRKILLNLKVKTSIGYNTLPPKPVKLACNIIDNPLTNLINSNSEKLVTVAPVFKERQ